MSTTPSSGAGNTTGSSQASATKNPSTQASRSAAHTQSPADQFASLLGLLSAASDAPLNTDGTEARPLAFAAAEEDPADAVETADLGDNPLAALLSWPGAPAFQIEPPRQGEAPVETQAATPDAGPGPGLNDPTGTAEGVSVAASRTSGAGAGSGALDLQGMTLLDHPVEAGPEWTATGDAATTATDAQRPSTAGRADASAFAARPANWRSTTALAHHTTSSASTGATQSSSPTTTTQIQLGQAAQARVAADPGLPAPRSTLTLDDRFSAASLAEGSSPLGGLHLSAQAGAQGGSEQAPPGSGGAFAEALNTERSESNTSDSEFTLMPETSTEETLPEEAALSPHQLRHASLRVGEGSEEAIDIQLALRGEQLNVDFRTDNPEARASLQHNASGTLADLLQRGGIQLGQVSVGAQSQGQGRQGQTAPRPASSATAARLGATGGNPGEDTRLPQAPLRRSDGSRPLDLFV